MTAIPEDAATAYRRGQIDLAELRRLTDEAKSKLRFQIGDRVIINTEVADKFFTIHDGSTGTIEDIDDGQYGIKLDQHVDGLEEWDNIFYACEGDWISAEILDSVQLLSEAVFDAQLTDKYSAVQWIVNLNALGKLWHFDDDPHEQINGKTSEPTFTPDEADKVAAIRDRMFEIARAEGFDPFETAVRLINSTEDD